MESAYTICLSPILITHDDPPTWNFRCAWSPDASRLVFARADVGGVPGLWVMDVDGGNRQFLTRGLENGGADHGRWVRLSVMPEWENNRNKRIKQR